MADQLIF